MHTDICSIQIPDSAHRRHHITRWLVAITAGLLLTTAAIAAPRVNTEASSTLDATANSVTQKPTLRIAIAEMLQEPLQPEAALLRRAFGYAGYHLELVPLPAQRGLRAASGGEVDGEFLRRREDITAFPSLLAIEEPLRHVELWVWMRSDRQCPSSLQALPKLTMATVLSYNFTRTLPVSSGSKKFQTNSITSSLRVLMAGRVDYVVFDKRGISHYKKVLPLDVKICFAKPLSSIDYFTFLHSKHRDKLPAITEALRRVKSEQTTP